ncbi:hypothetical protein JAN5088_00104 [Jannaschia rubra]|uniref:Thioredoxin-related protein n=2 Tax=Jannaschia rubra TaxID=282197 RepID=A0A0M6XJS1_9RHOB|nr:hypothetical protein JAN5088_00104 [Jannaschia rubra]SFF81206.1 hypothetical protein SAMN04488517_101313 [Jannaschia rubra]
MYYEMQPLIPALATMLCLAPGVATAEVTLVMGEEAGCIWCARWNAEVAPEYPLTAEGHAAPLRRIDIHASVPDDLDLAGRIRFTPTFILVHDGREIARREGYPGEEFFWPVLGAMLDDAARDIPELDGWRDAR